MAESGFLDIVLRIFNRASASRHTWFSDSSWQRCRRLMMQSKIAVRKSLSSRPFHDASRSRWTRWHLMLLCAWFLLSDARAQASQSPTIPDTDFQSWDELDIKTRIAPYLDINWITRLRFSSTISNPADFLFGADWNFSVNRHLVLTPSWYYFGSRSSSGVMEIGQSPVLGITPTLSRKRWSISDRNRFCGRFGSNGNGPSWDYRNRPQVEYHLTEAGHPTSIFVWDEETHYSSYRGWTRNRLSAGIRRTLQKRFIADIYYQREDDQIGPPKQINTAVVLMEMRLR